VRWRTSAQLPAPGDRLESPADPEARFATKRVTQWRGYKVHVTQTCDPERPHLSTDVQTTTAPVPDGTMTQAIEQALFERDLPPAHPVVDAGYTEADWIVTSQRQRGVAVVGPVRANTSWQTREDWQTREEPGYAVTQFRLDWQRRQAICPQGQRSVSWTPSQDRAGNPVISVTFSRPVCRSCPLRAQCTRCLRHARQLSVRVQADYAAWARVRAEQETAEWTTRYRQRAGVEGTFAQGVRRMGLRHARSLGLAKVQLQPLATAVALTLVRLDNWLAGVPWATTRSSRFARLGLAS
jgi:transposase